MSLEFYFFFLSLLHPLLLLGAKSVGSLPKHRMSNTYVATYSTYLTTAEMLLTSPRTKLKLEVLYTIIQNCLDFFI